MGTYNHPRPHTAAELKQWRLACGIAVRDAAAIVGVLPRTWYRWERGEQASPQMLALALPEVEREIYIRRFDKRERRSLDRWLASLRRKQAAARLERGRSPEL